MSLWTHIYVIYMHILPASNLLLLKKIVMGYGCQEVEVINIYMSASIDSNYSLQFYWYVCA